MNQRSTFWATGGPQFGLLSGFPTNVTILSQSKTKRRQRPIAEIASHWGESDAPHRCVAVRQPDHFDRGRGVSAKRHPRNLILFVPDGLRGRIVTPQTAPAMAEVRDKGVNFKNSHSLFPTFTMANGSAMASGHYLGDTGTFSNTIYTGYSVGAGRRHRRPFHRKRRGARRYRRTFQWRLSERGNHPEDGARAGLLDRGDRQARPDPAVRPHRPRQELDRDRRFHRRQERRSPVRRDEGRADQGRSSAGDAAARRQRQGGRRQDAGHHFRQRRAAGLYGRRRQQGRAADVQGAQQAVRAGVLVARPRRQPAQHRRQPQHHHARHQRPDLDGRHQERRQQSGAAAQGARRSRPRRLHQHHDLLRPRLLDDLEGEQDQPVGENLLRRHAEGFPARWASSRSIWPRR